MLGDVTVFVALELEHPFKSDRALVNRKVHYLPRLVLDGRHLLEHRRAPLLALLRLLCCGRLWSQLSLSKPWW